MATPEQLAAVNAAARHTEELHRAIVHDTAALEIERLRALLRGVVARAMPMGSGYVIRDEDYDALREEAGL